MFCIMFRSELKILFILHGVLCVVDFRCVEVICFELVWHIKLGIQSL